MDGGRNAYELAMKELDILKQMDHPFCLGLHEIINSPKEDKIYLVTEFYKNGSVTDLIN